MRLTRLRVENFRSIKQIEIELGETTVFIGPNDAGKTSILDAIRIVLTRRWGQRGTGFTEYDIHLATENDDPKTSSGVKIEARAEEIVAGEWPDEIQQDLTDIIQLDPISGKNSVTLSASCAWDAAEGSFMPVWQFLNAARAPLAGRSGRSLNLERFWKYLPVFYLGALRDADDEFSTRSQFWGRLLKAMEIPAELEIKVQRVLDLLNRKLLRADPRLGEIATTLTSVTRVAAQDFDGQVDLRLVPLKAWDILSKAQIILRNEATRPWLPLSNHGQGVQSLAVIFLFRAFVDHLLAETYEEHSAPVLALEEPETHLHPQAARTLWRHVKELPGQKIITTHSPYFVQHVPFRDLRLVRLTENGTEIHWLPASFSANLPHNAALDALVANSGGLLEYERATLTLSVNGKLPEASFRDLLATYGTHADRNAIEGTLRRLKDRTLLYITDEELSSLQHFARRIRGEIFFARRWFLVEGQVEYLVIHALAKAMGYDLDEHGVALIDTVNNGNPTIFAIIARAFSIPWLAVFDGDQEGRGYYQSIEERDFEPRFVADRVKLLPAGDFEAELIAGGMEQELRSILSDLKFQDALTMDQPTLLQRLRANKTPYAAALAARMAVNPALRDRMPQTWRDAIAGIRGLL